jgi:phosphoribosylformylglycinamidine synthase I
MKKRAVQPKVLIFSGYGLNCEEETAFAFQSVGAKTDIVHINDLIAGHKQLSAYQIIAFPGGFSYGDDTGSGNAYANRVRNHLWEKLVQYTNEDRLVIGICNGFQILANLGLVPALNKRYGERQAALMTNDSARYSNRWVDLRVESQLSPWLRGITSLSLPIAHGEGKLYVTSAQLAEMKKKSCIALRYVSGDVSTYLNLPANPNGSLEDIAGITDETGRVLGLMPHPERGMFFTQLPHWQVLKEKYLRNNQPLPEEGPGLQIFRNAVKYFD